MKVPLSVIFLLIFVRCGYCQSSPPAYFITANGNLYLPSKASSTGTYPLIGYDKASNPKVLIEGFGLGISGIQSVKPRLSLRGQMNISKHTYWDEPIVLTDANAIYLGTFVSASSDFSLGLNGVIHYSFAKKMSIGTGLGGQILLVSLSRVPEFNNYLTKGTISVNKFYKPFMPTVPVELSLKFEKVIFNIRYEYGLLNRFKKGLTEYKTDRYGLLNFEIGFRVK